MNTKRNRVISVREFQRIYVGSRFDDVCISKDDIIELRNYIDEQNSKEFKEQSVASNFLKPIKNGVQVNNYVGIIQISTGLTIEILPKIYRNTKEELNQSIIRSLFLDMLKTVRSINGKNFKSTYLNVNRNNLLEIFIAMFLSESDLVIKYGLKSSYVSIKSNEKFLKGKLLMTQHLRKNSINAANFYNEFDQYLLDVPENRLIKATLLFLLRISKDIRNLRLIREQLVYFDLVKKTEKFDKHSRHINYNRNYKYYDQLIEWCHIFLSRQSFTSFQGKLLSFAILFPMEKIFESYIAYSMRKCLADVNVSIQDQKYHLFDKTENSEMGYKLKPDIVIRDKNKRVYIVDTKWKILDKSGPKQTDLYQMYAYHTRYLQKEEKVKKVIMIYPYSRSYKEREFISLNQGLNNRQANIKIGYVDLLSGGIENQLNKLINLEE